MALASAGAWLTEWAAGREWAVQSFVALSGVALLSVVLGQRLKGAAAATDTKASAAMKREFHSFQRSYLGVFVVVMLADWLQGTHMYTLYTKYQQENASVSVGTLFFTGFAAAGLLGTFTGPLVDRYGRKRACLVYVALELLINSLEHFNHMSLLLLGRVLGGVSTSLLFSAFEAWMVTEHRRRVRPLPRPSAPLPHLRPPPSPPPSRPHPGLPRGVDRPHLRPLRRVERRHRHRRRRRRAAGRRLAG